MKHKKHIHNLPCGVATIKFADDYPILSANKNFYRFLGLKPNLYSQTLKGSSFIKRIAKEDYDSLVPYITRKVRQSQHKLLFEFRIDIKNIVHYILVNAIKTNKNKEDFVYQCVFIDITEKKEQEYLNKDKEQIEKITTKAKLLEQQLDIQLDYYKHIEKMQNEMKAYRHDLKNHFLCLKNLLENGYYKQAQDYLAQITSTYHYYEDMISTGNPILDAILYEKIQAAQQNNINVNKHIQIIPNIPIRSIDWCILIGNALDNAIDACNKIEEYKNRTIHISLVSKGNALSINIMNTTNGNMIREGDLFKTTKENADHHGFGLKNIKSVVEKYNGVLELKHENNTFTTIMLLCFE